MLSACRFPSSVALAVLAGLFSGAIATKGDATTTLTLTSTTLTSTLTSVTTKSDKPKETTTGTTISAGPGEEVVVSARVRGSLSVTVSTEADVSQLAGDARVVAGMRAVVAGAAGVSEAQVALELRVVPASALRRRLATATLEASYTIVVPAASAEAAAQQATDLGHTVQQGLADDLVQTINTQLAQVAPGVVTVTAVDVQAPVVDTVMRAVTTTAGQDTTTGQPGQPVVAGSTEPLELSSAFSGRARGVGLLLASTAALFAAAP